MDALEVYISEPLKENCYGKRKKSNYSPFGRVIKQLIFNF